MDNEFDGGDLGHPSPGGESQIAARLSRHKEFKAGIISYQNHSITVDCLIRDRSEKGAKLSVEQGHMIPSRFNLSIPMDGVHVDCEVRWRSDRFIGAEFVGPVEKDGRNARKQSLDVNLVVPQKTVSLRKRPI